MAGEVACGNPCLGILLPARSIQWSTMGIGGSDMYRQQILDHYKNPRNHGELADPTFSHTGENPMCGDTIVMDVVLDADEETIERVAFRGDGCAISQASASMLSEKLHGMTVDELQELDRDDVIDMLGVDISAMRVKCAVLAEKVAQDGADIYFDDLDVDKTTTEDD
jgi:nitrogen fixation NifU-like protein